MSKSCQGLFVEFVKCLRESDCMKASVLALHSWIMGALMRAGGAIPAPSYPPPLYAPFRWSIVA